MSQPDTIWWCLEHEASGQDGTLCWSGAVFSDSDPCRMVQLRLVSPSALVVEGEISVERYLNDAEFAMFVRRFMDIFGAAANRENRLVSPSALVIERSENGEWPVDLIETIRDALFADRLAEGKALDPAEAALDALAASQKDTETRHAD